MSKTEVRFCAVNTRPPGYKKVLCGRRVDVYGPDYYFEAYGSEYWSPVHQGICSQHQAERDAFDAAKRVADYEWENRYRMK